MMARGLMEMAAEAPAIMECVAEEQGAAGLVRVAGSPYSIVRVTLYYCFNCRSLERHAAIVAGVEPDDLSGMHSLCAVIGRN